MKILILTIITLCIYSFAGIAQEKSSLNPDLYGTGNWDADSLGNHRLVINVKNEANIVWALALQDSPSHMVLRETIERHKS